MIRTLFCTLTLAALAGPALAHVTLEQTSAAPGETTKITLRVPHGCDGEATRAVHLSLPEGVYAAKPMPKAGWTLETETGAYARPYMNHGQQMSEGLRQISWTGGDLPDAWYDEFTIRATIGPDVAPGTVLYFPTVQQCDNGQAAWTDTSGAKGAEGPAPKLLVVAGEAAPMGHDHAAAPAAVTLGALQLSGGFSRATLPNAPVGGGFLTITNTGTASDRLVSAETPVAARTEIHSMEMKEGVMVMRPLENGLEIPAGATVTLQPGGYHLMFMQLKQPLRQGGTVDVTLTFETAGTVTLPLAIGAPNARAGGQDHGAMAMPGHDHDHAEHN
ncbi:DUF1775 domain-containing protein [Pseudooceanicola sp. CBS1P-1]|uniref:DUF1775 domain-containing protein n=1 Tax=Pseudooceanicola albus TaxID=2692189 RepID=A0A6L7G7D0_9RHOB|nr:MULTISPECIES: DUF1775 domain-containing protein [Pseudooceanicola]MBT9386007.1 DUF1775 domain-containing protein [Pseudooceanicola endophyticus]MXN19572.1 DUF1775 domain-containing protein [Pseudooceanicola albus]